MSDREFLLSDDTNQWLELVAKRNALHLSHYRIICVLRDLSTSASELATMSGLDAARVRQRLKQLVAYGYVELVETLTDKTQIWGLVDGLRKPEATSYPTEASVTARRSRQTPQAIVDQGLETKHQPSKRKKAPVDDTDYKQYVAKEQQ